MRLKPWLPAVAMLAVACVATGDTPSPTVTSPTTTVAPTTSTTAISTADGLALFESCLAENGLVVESIPLDANGMPRFDLVMPQVDFTDADEIAAFSICSQHLSQGPISLVSDDEMRTLLVAALAEFAQCVRDHGVEAFPDPDPSFTGAGSPFPIEQVPYDDPGLETATRLCGERLAG